MVSGDFYCFRYRQQVADRLQKFAIGRYVPNRARVGAVPGIQLALQAIALGQQLCILRRQIMDYLREATPPTVAVDAGAR